ncbi:MAG: GAF domain-containing protein [Solirubrobacteraceae bacterium]
MTRDAYGRLRAAALEAIVLSLRAEAGVDRCTLRLEVPGEYFPVVHESRTSNARTLIGDREVSLQGQPVVEAILSGVEQVVQPDTATASEDPAFHAMLRHYGGLGAQIVTPVRERGTLLGIISLHHLGGPREWSTGEKDAAFDAAELVRRLAVGDEPEKSERE